MLLTKPGLNSFFQEDRILHLPWEWDVARIMGWSEHHVQVGKWACSQVTYVTEQHCGM